MIGGHLRQTHTQAKQKQTSEHTHTHTSRQEKMPGAKKKKMGNGKPPAARQLSLKDEQDDQQHYGRIVKLWGHGTVTVRYYGAGRGTETDVRMREIRAKVPIRKRQKKLRATVDGLVIFSLRDFGSEAMGDVIHTYREGEESQLRRQGELPAELLGSGARDELDEADPFAIEFSDGEEDGDY